MNRCGAANLPNKPRTLTLVRTMSALPPKADISTTAGKEAENLPALPPGEWSDIVARQLLSVGCCVLKRHSPPDEIH